MMVPMLFLLAVLACSPDGPTDPPPAARRPTTDTGALDSSAVDTAGSQSTGDTAGGPGPTGGIDTGWWDTGGPFPRDGDGTELLAPSVIEPLPVEPPEVPLLVLPTTADPTMSIAPDDHDGDGALAVDDCDDQDPLVFPGAAERCDGVDTDCDPTTTEEGLLTVDARATFSDLATALASARPGDVVQVCGGSWGGADLRDVHLVTTSGSPVFTGPLVVAGAVGLHQITMRGGGDVGIVVQPGAALVGDGLLVEDMAGAAIEAEQADVRLFDSTLVGNQGGVVGSSTTVYLEDVELVATSAQGAAALQLVDVPYRRGRALHMVRGRIADHAVHDATEIAVDSLFEGTVLEGNDQALVNHRRMELRSVDVRANLVGYLGLGHLEMDAASHIRDGEVGVRIVYGGTLSGGTIEDNTLGVAVDSGRAVMSNLFLVGNLRSLSTAQGGGSELEVRTSLERGALLPHELADEGALSVRGSRLDSLVVLDDGSLRSLGPAPVDQDCGRLGCAPPPGDSDPTTHMDLAAVGPFHDLDTSDALLVALGDDTLDVRSWTQAGWDPLPAPELPVAHRLVDVEVDGHTLALLTASKVYRDDTMRLEVFQWTGAAWEHQLSHEEHGPGRAKLSLDGGQLAMVGTEQPVLQVFTRQDDAWSLEQVIDLVADCVALDGDDLIGTYGTTYPSSGVTGVHYRRGEEGWVWVEDLPPSAADVPFDVASQCALEDGIVVMGGLEVLRLHDEGPVEWLHDLDGLDDRSYSELDLQDGRLVAIDHAGFQPTGTFLFAPDVTVPATQTPIWSGGAWSPWSYGSAAVGPEGLFVALGYTSELVHFAVP
jgi:hypothetical protein